MKNKTLLIILITILFYNCNSEINEKDIIGNWKVVEFISNTPELSPQLIEGAKSEALSSQYFFKENGTCSIKSNFNPSDQIEKYEILVKDRIIKMTRSPEVDNSEEEYQIISLNTTSMVWSQDLGDLGSLTMNLKKE